MSNVGNVEATTRMTRSRAAAVQASNGAGSSKPPPGKPGRLRILLGNSKRTAVDENNISGPLAVVSQSKRRAVLKDVTNVSSDGSCAGLINISKAQSVFERCKSTSSKISITTAKKNPYSISITKNDLDSSSIVKQEPELGVANSFSSASVQSDERVEVAEGMRNAGVTLLQESPVSIKLENNCISQETVDPDDDAECACENSKQSSAVASELSCPSNNAKEVCDNYNSTAGCKYINIDLDHKNPQMCSFYVADIYTNLRAAELERRPYSNFMETLQRDITQSMRGILVDWLVEVAEEYKLVPDTLYLTIYIIDSYLSQNYIERQRLQLLGITSMLIASKYEEICVPSVEKFCFITDNTYSREDVLKMEIQVLNYLSFHLSVPTAKTFLRRFLRAAQASSKVPTLVLEFLANYLTELTLLEYGFLNFLPSVIAASAIFLARWTLDQSDPPWNSTLEYYTSYKALELKVAVIAMQDLQKNIKNSPLNAIREKYRQLKFQSVAILPPQDLLPTLFL